MVEVIGANMRVISFCCEGMHQAVHRGLFDWLREQDADVICLQDLRATEMELDQKTFHIDGMEAFFFEASSNDFGGVAIYSRLTPRAVMRGLGFINGLDTQGRYIQADFDGLSVASLLAPTMYDDYSPEERQLFFDALQAHLDKITRKRRDYIFCGQFGLAQKKDDVQLWQEHQKTPGFLQIDRQWLSQLYRDIGYIDAFRWVDKDPGEYTWWPEGNKGNGWRTDLQVVSQSMRSNIEYGVIYKTKSFSHHAPLIVDYDLEIGLD